MGLLTGYERGMMERIEISWSGSRYQRGGKVVGALVPLVGTIVLRSFKLGRRASFRGSRARQNPE